MLMRRYCLLVLVGICCLVVGMALTGYSRPAVAHAETNIVTIQITGITQPSGFLPALLTVHVNDTIVFVNKANPLATYSVVANDQRFASPPIAPGQQWTTTLATPGVYDYTDPAHSSQMFGELVVVPASVELLPTPQPGAVATALAQDQLLATPASIAPQAQSFPLAVVLGSLGGLLLVGGIALVLLLRFRHRKHVTSSSAKRR
jgi:plastocyanin